jgi:acetoin utilization protein AcuB
MLVGDRMSKPVITIHPETSMKDALELMEREHVHRLPVVDKKGKLVGIISERELYKEYPSEATTLSVWELNYLLKEITIEKLMTRDVTTVTEDTPLEEAARIMVDKDFSGIPVVRDDKVVGMITETDLFKIFLEMLGARNPGVRLTVLMPETPGALMKVTEAIFKIGGNIEAVGTFLGDSTANREITIKVEDVEMEALREAVTPYVEKILDIREMLMV